MKRFVKYMLHTTYRPLLVKYLSKSRTYSYKGITLEIPPAVFHPGFFFSTKMLLRFISNKNLAGRQVLELGAGSGLLSIYAAQKRANVTASDINPVAVDCLRSNAENNGVLIDVVHSDLFANIPVRPFDLILINPPYYKRKPLSARDYAWYCGEHGEYFQELFDGISPYLHDGSEVYMVLCDGCDLEMIDGLAAQNRFRMRCVNKNLTWIETNYIFKLEEAPCA